MTLRQMADTALRRAWAYCDNPLRASIVEDPLFARRNTRDNTPAMVAIEQVSGTGIEIALMVKGGGAENKACFATLKPSDDVAEWILEQIPQMGAGWCPPGLMGIGIGGSADIAMRLAKEALYEPLDMLDLLARADLNAEETFRADLYRRINDLGIGAQGLGGLTTVLDVKVKTAPTHASAMPVALIPQYVASRVVQFAITPVTGFDLAPPAINDFPVFAEQAQEAIRVDLDNLTAVERESWQAGQRLLLSGRLLTGRDAAHKRINELLETGAPLPVSLEGRAIYYVGPVAASEAEAVGSAGPTTATRMDKFTPRLLTETGLALMVGKAERGPEVIEAIRDYKVPYLIAVGGAAVLVSRAILSARVVACDDLGMEAIHEFEVEDMPVIVAVDCDGNNIHATGPPRWQRGGGGR